MGLTELLERVQTLGGTFVASGGRLWLRPPCNDAAAARELNDLAPDLRTHRETLLRLHSGVPEPPDGDPLIGHPPITCRLCRCTWYCPVSEVRQLAADPAWCDRGGVTERRGKGGVIVRRGVPRCPFKTGITESVADSLTGRPS